MKSLVSGRFLLYLVAIWLVFPIPISSSTTVSSEIPQRQTKDERQIEEGREDAILNALVSIDPSLASKGVEKVETVEDAREETARQVKEIRLARKKQFKSLTWGHIKRMVTPGMVEAKEQFLRMREKNLQTVVSRAIGVSVQAEIAKERISLARFRIAKAIRDFLPETDFEADVKQGSLSVPAFVSDHWRMKLRIPVFRGGVLWNTLFLEMSNLEIAKREYDKVISDLIASVSQAYFEYERTQNIYHDREELMRKAMEQKKISDEKYVAKLISEIEKLNADSLYGQAQYDLETAQQELEIAKLELQKHLYLETADQVDVSPLYQLDAIKIDSLKKTPIAGSPTLKGRFEEDLGRLIELAYEHRPDLQVEASKLKAAQFAYRVSLGQRLPQFDMLVEFGELAEAFILDTADPHHKHEFRFGMEATWPFLGNTLKWTYDHTQHAPSVTQFQGGAGTRIRSNSVSARFLDDMGQFSSMLDAKINNLEQIVELEKTERDVVREVKEAYFNFNKALIQVESAYTRMGYRGRLAQLAKHRLETNEIQISEYLQAEMDYTEERGLIYKALSEFFLSKAKLNQAIGIRDYLPVEVLPQG